QAVATLSEPNREMPLLSSAVLEEIYGPSEFDHGLHQRAVKEGCALCHHHSDRKYDFPSCSTC
ncbi:MAG: hypothetical protein GTO49_13220, partial [Anaerolineae bacterium]|nr:hypothetical protein [Anaerolineae bacterium]